MPDELRRLLQSHDFVDRALQKHAPTLAPSVREELQQQRDGIFLKLLNHKSSDPRVTRAQLNFLLASLVDLAPKSEVADLLLDAGKAATDRLARLAETAPRSVGDLAPERFAILDTLSDRAGVIGRDYRYIYTNTANAKVYNANAAEFIGKPLWSVIDRHHFKSNSKNRFDACFAGRTFTHVCTHNSPDGMITYSVSYNPVRNRHGDVIAALLVARDVTAFAPAPEFHWPASTTPLFAHS